MQALPAPLLAAVNHLLGQASWAREKLAAFAGHSAQIKLPPFEAAFLIAPDGSIAAPGSRRRTRSQHLPARHHAAARFAGQGCGDARSAHRRLRRVRRSPGLCHPQPALGCGGGSVESDRRRRRPPPDQGQPRTGDEATAGDTEFCRQPRRVLYRRAAPDRPAGGHCHVLRPTSTGCATTWPGWKSACSDWPDRALQLFYWRAVDTLCSNHPV
jgi:hypothetical protein